jgi:hypothetical protein
MKSLKPINIIYELGIYLVYLFTCIYIGSNYSVGFPFYGVLYILFLILVASIAVRAYKMSWECLAVSSFSFGFLFGIILLSLFIYSESYHQEPIFWIISKCLVLLLLFGTLWGSMAFLWASLLKYFFKIILNQRKI